MAWLRELRAEAAPRFVIFASYGNDSIALIQLAHEQKLDGVTVVYSDTGWCAPQWVRRVEKGETWARSLGFETSRTESIGFANLAREKKGFPTQQFQWCSHRLKIEPALRWLSDYDPDCKAVCMVGVRREESQKRASFPEVTLRSENHGGRMLVAPLVSASAADRDSLVRRAGFEPLPHRSMECHPCVNSNRSDLRILADDWLKIYEIEELEKELGVTSKGKPVTLFRPHRYQGAVGIREVVKWALSEWGKYEPAVEEDLLGCDTGFCGS